MNWFPPARSCVRVCMSMIATKKSKQKQIECVPCACILITIIYGVFFVTLGVQCLTAILSFVIIIALLYVYCVMCTYYFPIVSEIAHFFGFALQSHLLPISCGSVNVHGNSFIWWNVQRIQFIWRKKVNFKEAINIIFTIGFYFFLWPHGCVLKKCVFCGENISLIWKRVRSGF